MSSQTGRLSVAGALGVLSPVFALTTSINNASVLPVLPVLGLLTIAGALLEIRMVIMTAWAGLAVAGLIQLVQFGHATNWLGGNDSTFCLLLALGVCLLPSLPRDPPTRHPPEPKRTNRWT